MVNQRSLRLTEQHERKSPTLPHLTLVVSQPPSEDDLRAREALQTYSPGFEERHAEPSEELVTPILDAIPIDGGLYRGIRSVLGYLENQKRFENTTTR